MMLANQSPNPEQRLSTTKHRRVWWVVVSTAILVVGAFVFMLLATTPTPTFRFLGETARATVQETILDLPPSQGYWHCVSEYRLTDSFKAVGKRAEEELVSQGWIKRDAGLRSMSFTSPSARMSITILSSGKGVKVFITEMRRSKALDRVRIWVNGRLAGQ